ncbi:hypothetical protein [Pedobacter sp.]
MKKLTLLILSIGLCVIVSCRKEDPYNIAGDYQLTEEAPITVSKRKMPVKIGVLNIISTLCPPNALCVSQGFGATDVAFKTNEGQITIKVCTGMCNQLPTKEKVTLNGVTYEVTLTAVKPLGSTGKLSVIINLKKL